MSLLWDDTLDVGWSTTRTLVESLSRTDIARYAGASGDVNTVHIDEPFAIQSGHPSVIAHGMHTMGLVGTHLASVVGHGALRRFSGRFLATVHPGDRLDCTITIRELVNVTDGRDVVLDMTVTSGPGRVVFKGEAMAGDPTSRRGLQGSGA